jgi:phospholipase/carboxylesterase
MNHPAMPERSLTRRSAVLAAMTSPLACRGRGGVALGSAAGGSGAVALGGGLQVARAGRMGEDERGGVAVVLLHGWGAPGDDLVALGHALERPRTRFFMPAAPLPERGGGRAWWHLDAGDRPAFAAESGDVPPTGPPHPQLAAARGAVQALLRSIRERYRPETVMLAGFSQGAMLSLDVALAGDPAVDRVAALSGLLLADSLPALARPAATRPAVFASHGRQDPVLPFEGGVHAKVLLERHGFAVTWRPFQGGHEIPAAIVADLATFLLPA